MTVDRGGKPNPESVGLPTRTFLYTVDQIAFMLNLPTGNVRRNYLQYSGLMTGRPAAHRMMAHNIAPPDQPREWRVSEAELIRWLKYMGFRIYERRWPLQ